MSPLEASEWGLILVCLIGSLVSVAIGTSCGLLFAAMVSVMPPGAALPVHGLIEGISSGIRWAVLRQHVDYRYLPGFVFGGAIGLLAGWPLIGLFSDQLLKLILGVFLLVTLWCPLAVFRLTAMGSGAITSCLTLVVGATGPLVTALLSRKLNDHRSVVGTQGACTVFQHWSKVVVFSLSGFTMAPYLGLIVGLTVATIMGTLMGRFLLSAIPAKYLRAALRTVVTLLGIRLVLLGLNIELTVS